MELRYSLPILVIVTTVFFAGCIEDQGKGSGDGIDSETEKTLISAPMGLDEGQTGTMSVPYVGVNIVDLDVKHHWNMPMNISGMRVNVSWTGASWDVELSIGTGDCPHSGMLMNSTQGGSGELSMEFWTSEEDPLETSQWFCHLGLPDTSGHRGESINYVFEVTLFSFEEIDCEGDVCPA
jgi:hypothetical protein